MCVYYRGAFRTGIHCFRKKAQSQTLDLEAPLYNPGYLPGYSYCFIASDIRLHLQETPSQDSMKRLKERRLGALYEQVGYSRFLDLKILN